MSQQQPSGFSRLPKTSRYALIAIGVLILIVAALAVVTGGDQDDERDTHRPEHEPGAGTTA